VVRVASWAMMMLNGRPGGVIPEKKPWTVVKSRSQVARKPFAMAAPLGPSGGST
jgi:hypothetical protein